ncbi:MAG: CCA tRNA nucleotidyltransferase [Planctomycetes bacterium]|nr:CCA tRNA nucleotidyltransferase [Planctomycetota bacterium]
MADSLFSAALSVVRRLRERGHEACFAGGCVRDRLLGRPVADYDVATDALPDSVIAAFPRTVEVGKAFGVVTVLVGPHAVEVATFRSDHSYRDGRRPEGVTFSDLRTDVERRDFTINAMMWDPVEDRVIDLVGGRADLASRTIRAVGDPERRFSEDKLRILRAVRFAATLDFAIEPATASAIRRFAPEILQVSWERIAAELKKILVAPRRAEGMELMRTLGLLAPVLPECEATVGVPQPPEFHPEGDVWTHTKLALRALESPSFVVALATLLHDVGKPRTIEHADRIRFNGHDKVGAEMAAEICDRLRLSREEKEAVAWIVLKHLAFLDADRMRKSTLKRLFASPLIEELFQVARADAIGSMAEPATVERMRALRASLPPDVIKPPPLLRGADLIAMGFAPGPLFKEILREVEDAQLEGRVRTAEEARELVRARWSR